MNSKSTATKGLGMLLKNPQIWRASDSLHDQNCVQQTKTFTATGFSQLDKELPDGGWPTHGLIELLCPRWGVGEIPLLSPAMAQLSQQGRWLAWVSPPWMPYAPGLLNAGINLKQILIIKPSSEKEALWAMEECLQSGSCSAVLGWPNNPLPQQLKRLHIAAQKGDSLCALMRHEQHAQQPSPAPLRIELGALHTKLSLRILKRRGSWTSEWLSLPLPQCMALLSHNKKSQQTNIPTTIDSTATPLPHIKKEPHALTAALENTATFSNVIATPQPPTCLPH